MYREKAHLPHLVESADTEQTIGRAEMQGHVDMKCAAQNARIQALGRDREQKRLG